MAAPPDPRTTIGPDWPGKGFAQGIAEGRAAALDKLDGFRDELGAVPFSLVTLGRNDDPQLSTARNWVLGLAE